MSQSNTPKGPYLELKQTQGLVMTPQLRHAISLLQMSNMDLAAHLRQEIQSNPFLEIDNGQELDRTEPEESSEKIEKAEPRNKDDYLDADYSNVWQDDQAGPSSQDGSVQTSDLSWKDVGSGGSRSFESADYSLENRLSDTPSIFEHISEQITLELADPHDRIIAQMLMDGLDENGFFKGKTKEIAKSLNCDNESVLDVLERVQQFDPPGIFAEDIAQCLAIQLKERDRLSETMQTLLANIELVQKHDYKKLAQVCNVDDLTLRALLSEIRTLNPRPASDFREVVSQTRIPDVLVRRAKAKESGDKMWVVELNPNSLPKILINRKYYATIKEKSRDKKEKEYLTDRFNAASWLARALDQRAESILKVATEIVAQQEAFFLYGVEYLKPLVLKDIAKEVDLHESTVSRVTTDKYMATSRGVHELKFFFSSSLGSSDGGMEHSGQAVKARIRKLIEEEALENVFSDDAIVGILEDEGISIARRTVAKYRKAMNIPSSSERRRQLKSKEFSTS